jgi:hypothetical protein
MRILPKKKFDKVEFQNRDTDLTDEQTDDYISSLKIKQPVQDLPISPKDNKISRLREEIEFLKSQINSEKKAMNVQDNPAPYIPPYISSTKPFNPSPQPSYDQPDQDYQPSQSSSLYPEESFTPLTQPAGSQPSHKQGEGQKELIKVVKELPVEPVRVMQREDGVIVRFITIEEAIELVLSFTEPK